MTNREKFYAEYRKQLRLMVELHPEEYTYSVDKADAVADKMIAAIELGSHNKDGSAFKATCKTFKIKHTYKAIKEFLES